MDGFPRHTLNPLPIHWRTSSSISAVSPAANESLDARTRTTTMPWPLKQQHDTLVTDSATSSEGGRVSRCRTMISMLSCRWEHRAAWTWPRTIQALTLYSTLALHASNERPRGWQLAAVAAGPAWCMHGGVVLILYMPMEAKATERRAHTCFGFGAARGSQSDSRVRRCPSNGRCRHPICGKMFLEFRQQRRNIMVIPLGLEPTVTVSTRTPQRRGAYTTFS